MKKWHLGVLFLLALFISVGATTSNKPDDDGFKNLQILPKNTTDKEMHAIMRDFSLSLGVRCGFCHASWADSTKRGLDFASDSKEEKKIARHMMQMTASLNANYFNFNNSTRPDTIHMIMCYTCHRGTKEPDGKSSRMALDSLMSQMQQMRNKKQ